VQKLEAAKLVPGPEGLAFVRQISCQQSRMVGLFPDDLCGLACEKPVGSWRTQEEVRRFGRNKLATLMGYRLIACFESWQKFTEESKLSPLESFVRQVTPSEDTPTRFWNRPNSPTSPTAKQLESCLKGGDSSIPVISSRLVGKVEGKDLLAEMSLLENLYESRVGAAERLLAFFVIFHRAVEPLSRLPGCRFDIDRSESRLRVASTPAPIPFVEELPHMPRLAAASMRIQKFVRQRQGVSFSRRPHVGKQQGGLATEFSQESDHTVICIDHFSPGATGPTEDFSSQQCSTTDDSDGVSTASSIVNDFIMQEENAALSSKRPSTTRAAWTEIVSSS
jgi:hypothetical protein